jgi:NitT/TauT family transport system permease protein
MLRTVTWPDLRLLLEGAGATFLRVNAALLISAAVDHSRRRRHRPQPQARPHRPAGGADPGLGPGHGFLPILLIGLVKIGGGLGIGSIALMLLGTQWYILFNVIAGAMSIPSDLREAASLYHFTRWQRWTRLILPASFPISSPAWSRPPAAHGTPRCIAEYSHVKDRTLQTIGLGAQIDAATDSGRFPILLLATILISLMVVTMNRLVWRRLYRLAETRYKLEG